MVTTPPALDMGSILTDTANRVVVCCGAGGGGKTTTAAAMALRAAEYGRTVVVLTIDPAKRLAQALGIKDLGNAPKRLGSFMDSRLWRLLLAPGRGIGKLVTGAVGLAMKALSTVLGSQMLSDAAAFVQSLDATFGGFREKADRTYELLKRRGTQFVVVSAAEPDALREASFFVDRLSQEHMPLAGLILNRTHPTLSELHAEKADEAAEELEKSDPEALGAAVLR